MDFMLNSETCLPEDGCAGTLVGRAWVPGDPPGPSVVIVRSDGVFDISRTAAPAPRASVPPPTPSA